MSHHTRTVILLLVLIILVIIGWVWYGMSSSSPAVSENNPVAGNQPLSAQTSADVQNTPNPADVSDAALESDLNSVDTQMGGLDTDSAAVNQSIGQ